MWLSRSLSPFLSWEGVFLKSRPGKLLEFRLCRDQVPAEPFAVSPDTRNLLAGMGYKITQQSPWGAAEAILIGPEKNMAGGQASSSGNDAMIGGGAEPGILYGANDDRRPAGAAIGY